MFFFLHHDNYLLTSQATSHNSQVRPSRGVCFFKTLFLELYTTAIAKQRHYSSYCLTNAILCVCLVAVLPRLKEEPSNKNEAETRAHVVLVIQMSAIIHHASQSINNVHHISHIDAMAPCAPRHLIPKRNNPHFVALILNN